MIHFRNPKTLNPETPKALKPESLLATPSSLECPREFRFPSLEGPKVFNPDRGEAEMQVV